MSLSPCLPCLSWLPCLSPLLFVSVPRSAAAAALVRLKTKAMLPLPFCLLPAREPLVHSGPLPHIACHARCSSARYRPRSIAAPALCSLPRSAVSNCAMAASPCSVSRPRCCTHTPRTTMPENRIKVAPTAAALGDLRWYLRCSPRRPAHALGAAPSVPRWTTVASPLLPC